MEIIIDTTCRKKSIEIKNEILKFKKTKKYLALY